MKTVDIAHDTDVWVGVPTEWSEDTWPDHRDWAREAAEAVYTDAADRGEVDHLALVLTMLAESPLLAPELAQQAFVHVPEPTSDVLPVYVQVFQADGERDDALRDMSGADTDAVEPPVVEPFETPHLGEGLRVVRYSLLDDDGGLLMALAYAFRREGLDVRVWTSHVDPGRVLRALDDIDALVRAVRVVEMPSVGPA